ncbi:MAG: DNA recombination protein RmuC, partial [Sphingomonas sp.]
MIDPVLAALILLLVLAAIIIALQLRGPARQEHMLHMLEYAIDQARADAETTRGLMTGSERALAGSLAALSSTMIRDQGEARALLETKLREMSEQAALRLGAIQNAVTETLATTVEKQMTGSFQRVIDQFGQVQKAMTDVQAVTAQIGDLKRIFSN